MSSYFDDASLVMIPSGYKTSKVYSVKPTDGSGDLTFSRSNDTATRVNSAGLIEKVRTNVALQSQNFSSGAWLVLNATKVSTTNADPNGGNTACNITWSASINTYLYGSFAQTGYYTVSMWVKSNGGGNNFRLFGDGTAINSSDFTATAEWQRFSFSFNATGGSSWGIRNNSTQDAADLLVAFAQLEQGDIATDYIATTSAAVSVGPVANVPRLDYLGSSCPRLLLEPQRSNLITYSEQIDNAAWVKGNSPTITTNIATAPDGTTSADGIQATDGINYKTITQSISVASNSTLTLSFFVKKETSETAYGGFTMYFQGGTAKLVYGIVNAVSGTVTYASSDLTATTKVESFGNYWRISSTVTDNGANTLCALGYYATLSTNGTSLNNGAGSVRTIWGFQAEIGAYATSYIPTLGATSTRGSDSCSKTGISSLIGQTEGTLYWEGSVAGSTSAIKRLVSLSDGTLSNAIQIQNSTNGTTIQYVILAGAVQQAVISISSAFTFGERFKIAVTYKANDFVVYINGVQVGTSTSGSVPATSAFAFSRGDGSTAHEGDVNQALLFKTRLTNAQLAELTTL